MKLKRHQVRLKIPQIINKFWQSLLKRKVLLGVIVGLVSLLVFLFYSLYMVYVGINLHKTQKAQSLKEIVHNVVARKIEFIPNYFKGVATSKPTQIRLDIKFKDYQKMTYYRKVALSNYTIPPFIKEEEFSAELISDGQVIPVKLKLMGFNLDHIGDYDKWSFRVKAKKNNTFFGMKKFSLLVPQSRGYLSEWIYHMLKKREGLISLRYDFVDVTINGKHRGLYVIEEHFDKRLIENNNLREGVLFKPGLDKVDVYNKNKIKQNPVLKKQLNLLNKLWQAFLVGQIPANKLFDIDKLAKFYAITDSINGHHSLLISDGYWNLNTNLNFYFNPITNLIEPIGREGNLLRYSDRRASSVFISAASNFRFHRKVFNDSGFVNKYIQALDKISKTEYLDNFFENIDKEMQKKLNIIYKYNPFYAYPKEFLYENQKYIRSELYSKKVELAVYYQQKNKKRLQLRVENLQVLPIKIISAKFGDLILESATEIVLSAKEAKKVGFIIPSDFVWPKTDENLEIGYKVLGLDDVRTAIVFPWSHKKIEPFNYNPTKQEPNYKKFNLKENEKLKTIEVKKKLILSKDLVIPAGYTLIAGPGSRINLINQAKLILYSPLKFIGSKKAPIKIYSSDSKGQGIVVMNAKEESVLEYVQFNNLSNPAQAGWSLTGAVNFYESPVVISNCLFNKNRSEDALNIIRSKFEIKDTLFEKIKSDAFDSDFSNGIIKNTSFINCGNDAIDVSGSFVEVEDVLIDGVGDKGISAGEGSQMIVKNIEIKNAEIAVASKDSSRIDLQDSKISKSKVGFAVFQKKSEFGPGIIEALNIKLKKVKVPYLVEKKSTLLIDGKKKKSKQKKVKEILYGNEYGKSSK